MFLAGLISTVIGLVPLGAGLAVFLDPLRRKTSSNGSIRVASLESLPPDGIPRVFPVLATRVRLTSDTVTVDLSDGRTIAVPLLWFPRLTHGSVKERSRWRLIGRGQGIHWPDLDEDVSVANLLDGEPSGESQSSFKKWLAARVKKNRGSRRSGTGG